MSKDAAPLEQFKNEIKAVFIRWWEESDLDENDMALAIVEVTEEWCETQIEFESDIDLDDES